MLTRRKWLAGVAASALWVHAAVAWPVHAIVTPSGTAVYNGNSLTNVAAFDTWLGKKARIQLVSFDQSSWANFASGITFETGLFAGKSCQWSVPMATAFGDLPAVVSGTHDAVFTACATAILAALPASERGIIRLGWELDQMGQPWRPFDSSGTVLTVSDFINAYRRIVGLFRAVDPHRFMFVWCPNCNDAVTAQGLTIADCYPGDAYVDIVGLDLYFQKAFDNHGNDGTDIYFYRLGQGAGLQWIVDFAKAQGKYVCMGEYGTDDNTSTGFFSRLLQFFKDNNFLYHGVWNDAQYKLSDDQYPALSAVYKTAFG